MFAAIMTFLTTNFPTFITFLGGVLDGGIDLIYTGSALTDTGEMLLLGSIVGLGMFALRFVRSLIPFIN